MAQTATVTYQTAGSAQITAQCEGIASAAVPVTVTAPSGTPAQRILAYLTALPQQATHRCIVGEMMENPSPQLSAIDSLKAATGKYVGLYGTSFTYNLSSLTANVTTMRGRGAVTTGICDFKNPQTGGAETDTTAAIHNTVTGGTAAHTNFFGTQLPALATTLKGLRTALPGLCLLIRPFREENGAWFWWGHATVADFVSLWRQTHDYLNVTQGLADTLLWDYNVYAGATGIFAQNYPGAVYVDVVSFDWYGNTPATSALSAYNALLGLNKPIHWAEFGCNNATSCTPGTFDTTIVLNAVKNTFPKCFAVSCWNGGFAWGTQLNANTLMNDPVIATATDVAAPSR